MNANSASRNVPRPLKIVAFLFVIGGIFQLLIQLLSFFLVASVSTWELCTF